jgi:predicted acylesterase/phospholipase RssA
MVRSSPMTTYDSVVMAGGGSRTFWHAGFWAEVEEPLRLRPTQIATVSAGAAMACAIVSRRVPQVLRLFQDATRRNPKNAYWENLLREAPVFPHERMYRKALLDFIDTEVLRLIHAGPDLRVLLGHAPSWLGPRAGAALAAAAYNFDKRVWKNVHPRLPSKLGFRAEVVSVRECPTPEVLADLILGSSCTPPMTSLQRWRGRYVLDGGVIDNVPVCALAPAPGPVLVLLSRQYDNVPNVPERTYVQPSQPIPVTAWDYTNPDGLQVTYDLGRRDGEAFAKAAAG